MSGSSTSMRDPARPRTCGPGRTLIVFYFIMTIAALARSIFEIVVHFQVAPVAYLLSLLSGIVYLVATIALITPGRRAFRIALRRDHDRARRGAGDRHAASVIDFGLFPFSGDRSTVWAYYGLEYLLIPLALPDARPAVPAQPAAGVRRGGGLSTMRVFHGVGEVPAGLRAVRGHDRQVRRAAPGPSRGDRRPAGRRRRRARAHRGDLRPQPARAAAAREPARRRSSAPARSSSCSSRPGSPRCSCSRSTRRAPPRSPRRSSDEVLVDALHVRRLLVGDDFRFGRGGRGDIALLTRMGPEHGFAVEVQQQIETAARRVSSTWIRELLAAGAIEEAASLLGRPPAVRGVVVHGAHRGRELGYPTANLAQESDGMIPADGVYAGRLVDGSDERRLPGRDLGRQQPDVRGRAAEAGRGVRARPHARPLRPRRRRGLHAPHPRADRLRGDRAADRADGRRRRAASAPSSADPTRIAPFRSSCATRRVRRIGGGVSSDSSGTTR